MDQETVFDTETSSEIPLEPLQETKDDSSTIVTEAPRPRGGQRKDGMPAGSAALAKYTPVPAPRYRKFLSDYENPHQNSKAAWKYWNALPDWAKGQIDAYIYRDHPILYEPPLDENDKPKYLSCIDKIPGTEPLTADEDLLNRYGCGSYHIYLSETASPKKTDKALCQIWVKNVGSNNYRSNPPTDNRISDITQVDVDHPANKAYVAYLRAEGKMPEQVDGRIKEHEMATVEAVKEVTQQQGVLVKEIIGMAKERGQSQDNSARVQAEVMADASKRSHEMTTEAAKQSISMVREAFDQAKAMLPAPATNTGNQDAVSVALEIVKLLKEGGNSNDGEIALLRTQLAQMQQSQAQAQQSQIAALQEQIKTLIEAKVTSPAQTASPFAAMNEGLDSLEKFNTVMGRLRGEKEEEETVVDAVSDAAPKWMRPILPFIPGLVQGVTQYFQMRQQQQPAYYQTPDGRILPLVQPQVMQPQPQIQAPMQQQQQFRPQQFGPQPVPPPAPNPQQQDPIYQLLSSISIPLLNSLQVNGTGTDFADWFIGGYGEQVFDEVSQLGPDMLYTAISTFPPINQHPIFQQTDQDYVKRFVAEFCDPKFPQGEGEEEEARVEPSETPA